ncbi:B3/4 domain-containing protein [Bacillus dakarensis]|uniref:B3/B4 domain-containing protein n=1 Tax=Robertmurraya dakarensis TaxID=1926278 RepID=UPI000980EBCC|nr:phenylalanine--tRNA ligase beta subunit-related protein [Bacillus dakarensis]
MEVMISPHICSRISNFKIGIIQYENIEVAESPQMLKGRLQLFQESLYFELEDKTVTSLEGISEWRSLFKALGKDPNRYRHSAEAMYRRVQKHNFLTPVNSAIDLNNFFSLQYQIPLGIYDMNSLEGDLMIRAGDQGEEYLGLNGRMNSLESLIVSADQQGPFGSPFVDSKRSAVSNETTQAIHIVYLRPSMKDEDAEQMVLSLMNMFIQLHGGNGRYSIIKC